MKALEDALLEMEPGEERTVELAAADAYGEYDESAVQHFPTYKVPNGENLPVGEYIGWTSPRNIEPIPAKVVSVENQVATIDFNHPLAGKDIVYWVKLLELPPFSPLPSTKAPKTTSPAHWSLRCLFACSATA